MHDLFSLKCTLSVSLLTFGISSEFFVNTVYSETFHAVLSHHGINHIKVVKTVIFEFRLFWRL